MQNAVYTSSIYSVHSPRDTLKAAEITKGDIWVSTLAWDSHCTLANFGVADMCIIHRWDRKSGPELDVGSFLSHPIQQIPSIYLQGPIVTQPVKKQWKRLHFMDTRTMRTHQYWLQIIHMCFKDNKQLSYCRDSARLRPLRRSRSFKIWYKSKARILPHIISHRFPIFRGIGQIIAFDRDRLY